MGIVVISSFAAREVFVGTMQTLFPAEEGFDNRLLKERLSTEINQLEGLCSTLDQQLFGSFSTCFHAVYEYQVELYKGT